MAVDFGGSIVANCAPALASEQGERWSRREDIEGTGFHTIGERFAVDDRPRNTAIRAKIDIGHAQPRFGAENIEMSTWIELSISATRSRLATISVQDLIAAGSGRTSDQDGAG
jgi:hypothetical protein